MAHGLLIETWEAEYSEHTYYNYLLYHWSRNNIPKWTWPAIPEAMNQNKFFCKKCLSQYLIQQPKSITKCFFFYLLTYIYLFYILASVSLPPTYPCSPSMPLFPPLYTPPVFLFWQWLFSHEYQQNMALHVVIRLSISLCIKTGQGRVPEVSKKEGDRPFLHC